MAPVNGPSVNKVQDSGSEYGDINETDLEGEEILEKIDERALAIFPICFFVFNLTYWLHYLLVGKEPASADDIF